MPSPSTFSFEEFCKIFSEKLTSTDVYFSLAFIHASLCYIWYIGYRKGYSKFITPNLLNDTSEEERHSMSLEDCDYTNIKVTKILIHPIKSCRGTSVSEGEYTEEGLELDRKLAIIDARTHKVITAREQPCMVLIKPRVVIDKSDPCGGHIHVSFMDASGCEPFVIPLYPTDGVLDTWQRLENIELWGRNDIDGYVCQSEKVNDRQAPSRTLSRYLGKDVYLVLKGPRPRPCAPTQDFPSLKASTFYQDGYPLLVTSEESLLAVQNQMRGEVGKQGVADRWSEDNLVIERFRPNIVLAGTGVPWAEDLWESIRIGDNPSTISLVSKCTRCLLPNVDPETGLRDKAVPYKVLLKFRTGKNPAHMSKPCFGCNGVPMGLGDARGIVRVGDRITVLKSIHHEQ